MQSVRLFLSVLSIFSVLGLAGCVNGEIPGNWYSSSDGQDSSVCGENAKGTAGQWNWSTSGTKNELGAGANIIFTTPAQRDVQVDLILDHGDRPWLFLVPVKGFDANNQPVHPQVFVFATNPGGQVPLFPINTAQAVEMPSPFGVVGWHYRVWFRDDGSLPITGLYLEDPNDKAATAIGPWAFPTDGFVEAFKQAGAAYVALHDKRQAAGCYVSMP